MSGRISDARRHQLEQELLAVLAAAYLRSQQQALDRQGRGDTAKLTLAQRTKLKRFVQKRAQLIQSGTNRYLDNAGNDLPLDATPTQKQQAESDRLEKVLVYNAAVLGPYLYRWANQQGTLDAYTGTPASDGGGSVGDGMLWAWSQATDYVDECTEADAESPASLETLLAIAGGSPPIHERCDCSLEPYDEGTQQVVQLASDVAESASLADPGITGDMSEIADAAGGHLVGLENRLKTTDSLERKIVLDSSRSGISTSAAANRIGDALRYTYTYEPDAYAAGVESAVQGLQARGYQLAADKWRNTWGDDVYRAINSNWIDPATGHVFEIQFHTPESVVLKELNHPLYEEYRQILDRTTPRALELWAEMVENAERLAGPEGVERLIFGTLLGLHSGKQS